MTSLFQLEAPLESLREALREALREPLREALRVAMRDLRTILISIKRCDFNPRPAAIKLYAMRK